MTLGINEELLKEINKTGEKEIESLLKETRKTVEEKELEKESINKLKETYENIVEILKEWSDLKEEYYNIIALWIIGTYMHNQFPTYPFLFFNAMRGSGKSRTVKLIIHLSKQGALLNSLTEAELFRSKGTLGIDEFEGITRKGVDNLRELLNSAYKKGTKVRRMRKVKTATGEEQQVEQFEVYRPIVMANINGMEDVLGDRCLTLILERSNNSSITNLMEIFEYDTKIEATRKLLTELFLLPKSNESCSLCSVVTLQNIYTEWNNYVKSNYTNYIKHTNNINYINYTQLFKSIKLADINGRELELSFPLLVISAFLGVEETTLQSITTLMTEKRQESMVENRDISLIDYLSQEIADENFILINDLTRKFKEFLGTTDEEINSKWVGRALKRLNLITEKRRKSRGNEVRLNYAKAIEKVKMFK